MYVKEKKIWQILIQAIRGLRDLHALNIMHRDMKVSIVTF